MHEVDDFILPVTTRFQNRATLGQTTDTAPTECAAQQQSLSGEASIRDDTKFPDAVHLARGNRKTPPKSCSSRTHQCMQQPGTIPFYLT